MREIPFNRLLIANYCSALWLASSLFELEYRKRLGFMLTAQKSMPRSKCGDNNSHQMRRFMHNWASNESKTCYFSLRSHCVWEFGVLELNRFFFLFHLRMICHSIWISLVDGFYIISKYLFLDFVQLWMIPSILRCFFFLCVDKTLKMTFLLTFHINEVWSIALEALTHSCTSKFDWCWHLPILAQYLIKNP